jgi:mono/diheme cytochrome c family protein
VHATRFGKNALEMADPCDAGRREHRENLYTIGGGGSGSKKAAPPSSATTPTNLAAGATLFAGNCTSCHGVDGRGGHVGPGLTPFHGSTFVPVVVAQVTHGGGGMPAFNETLTAPQIRDVAAYVTSLARSTKGTS